MDLGVGWGGVRRPSASLPAPFGSSADSRRRRACRSPPSPTSFTRRGPTPPALRAARAARSGRSRSLHRATGLQPAAPGAVGHAGKNIAPRTLPPDEAPITTTAPPRPSAARCDLIRHSTPSSSVDAKFADRFRANQNLRRPPNGTPLRLLNRTPRSSSFRGVPSTHARGPLTATSLPPPMPPQPAPGRALGPSAPSSPAAWVSQRGRRPSRQPQINYRPYLRTARSAEHIQAPAEAKPRGHASVSRVPEPVPPRNAFLPPLQGAAGGAARQRPQR